MSAFVESAHPRRATGQFAAKANDAPAGDLAAQPEAWAEAGGGCTCKVNPRPFTHYGAVEPGDALEPDPDCLVHFPVPGESDADYAEWIARNEQWAEDAAAGRISEPDTDSGTVGAWTSVTVPF